MRVTNRAPAELTGATVGAEARKFAKARGLVTRRAKPARADCRALAIRKLNELSAVVEKFPNPAKFHPLLLGISKLIDQRPSGGVVDV